MRPILDSLIEDAIFAKTEAANTLGAGLTSMAQLRQLV